MRESGGGAVGTSEEDTMSDSKTMDRARQVMADAVDGTREVIDEGIDEARERFEEVTDDLSRSARRAQRDVRRRAERMGTAARERYDAASESVRAGYNRARRQAVEFSGDVDEFVRENPGKSILIAAGLGFLIGILVRGGRRRDDF